MEPDKSEIGAKGPLGEVGALCTWCGLQAGDLRTAYFAALGMAETTATLLLARLALADYKALISAIKIDQGTSGSPNLVALTPIQASQLGYIWETAQYVCELKKLSVVLVEEAEKKAAEDKKHELAKLAAAPSTSTSSSSAGAIVVAKKTVAAEVTVDQSDRKSEYPILSEKDLQACYKRYHDRMGSGIAGAEPTVPHHDCEPSLDQLSALHAMNTSGSVPYVDFSIWGPHAARLKKRLSFQGYSIGPDGQLHITELRGPSSFEEWLPCWGVFRTACIMLAIASPETLDRYAAQIKKLSTRYGTKAWLLTYQADVRMRLEQIERIKRVGASKHAASAANAALPPCGYDPAMPWEWCLDKALSDTSFWHDEVEAPALLIRAQVDKLGDHLGLEVAGNAGSMGAANAISEPAQLPPGSDSPRDKGNPGGRLRGGGKGGKKGELGSPRQERVHQHNGERYTHNRSGRRLCEEYNSGNCTATTRDSGGLICSATGHSHQCELCLGQHPARPKNGPPCSRGSTIHSSPYQDKKGHGGKGKRGKRGKWSY